MFMSARVPRSALVPRSAPLVVRALGGVVAAFPVAACELLVPALGVADVLAPGELLLGTVAEGVLGAPAAPALLPVCPLATPNAAKAAMAASDMRIDFVVRMVFSEIA